MVYGGGGGGSGSPSWRFFDAGGVLVFPNTTEIISVTATQRVILTHLTHSLSGGSTDWSLIAGARTVYANGVRRLDDNTPGTIGGTLSVEQTHRFGQGQLTFGVGESLTITSGAAGNVVVRYRIEEIDA